MDIATFIAGDLDFLPVFDAISTTRVRTKLIFDPMYTPAELVYSADQIEPLTARLLVDWMNAKGQEKCGGLSSGSGKPQNLIDIRSMECQDKIIKIGRDASAGDFVAYIEGSEMHKRCRNAEVLIDWFYQYPSKKILFK